MNGKEHEYDDIIDHEHYTSKTRPHMSMHDRAAQFSPFAALSGYDDAVSEKEKLVRNMVLSDESGIPVMEDP
ncbi:MAG: hypothetical protein IKO11_02045 [Lachnospiraceae bacterium]|nr:hypothetical protein [Lachnospiraceae bacterium]